MTSYTTVSHKHFPFIMFILPTSDYLTPAARAKLERSANFVPVPAFVKHFPGTLAVLLIFLL